MHMNFADYFLLAALVAGGLYTFYRLFRGWLYTLSPETETNESHRVSPSDAERSPIKLD